ncbi:MULTISPECIES: hypothetical protein [Pseudarthrobacter]|uniref:hypothetical protein n=1 Tax=Pseudarthrobacter TaxID=1742993 RepID=UPI0013DCC1CC|nr:MULTISPECIES: hypothetical protein [Pseudarthrobacter]MDQ0000092.1 hypothetical protein [Pseudarthrobacter sulfonivorans]
MSMVVVAGAVLECSHGGRITVSAGDARLTVDGHGAVPAGAEAGLSFASASPPCKNTTPEPSPAPCTTGAALPGGAARKLAVGGRPVLLATANGLTTSKGPSGTWKVADAGQTTLEAS